MPSLLTLVCLMGAAVPMPSQPDRGGAGAAPATQPCLETSFVQTRTLAMGKHPLVSRGVVAYRRPGQLRWEYTSPLPTVLVVRDDTVERVLKHGSSWVVDHAARLGAMQAVLRELVRWFAGDFAASGTFRPELHPALGERPAYVVLVPADPFLGKLIAHITLVLGERPGSLAAIDIVEPSGDVVHIAFEKPRACPVLPDERFELPR